jgi:hypothetical protein
MESASIQVARHFISCPGSRRGIHDFWAVVVYSDLALGNDEDEPELQKQQRFGKQHGASKVVGWRGS